MGLATRTNVPKVAEEILSLANDCGWATNETWEAMPITLNYDDGSARNIDTDTYQLVGSKGKAMFMIGWYINPITDRWNISIRHVLLVTANEMELRIADALDVLPNYVYWDHLNYKGFKSFLAIDDPEDTLSKWHYPEEEHA